MIGTSTHFDQHCCVDRAEKFKREYNQVGVNLVVENTRRCCQAVARGELDFAVVGGQIPQDAKHLLLVSSIGSVRPYA